MAALATPVTVSAAETSTQVDETGTVGVSAGDGVGGIVYTYDGPRCMWRALSVGELENLGNQPGDPPSRATEPPDSELTPEQRQARDDDYRRALEVERERRQRQGERFIGGVRHLVWSVACPNGTDHPIRVVPADIDVDDLAGPVRDEAVGKIELPVPNASPKLENPGLVGLGYWLAVEPQVVAPISAQAGRAWITLSPEMKGIRYEFDDGDGVDVVECVGFGDPIRETSVKEQSPLCGYTFTRSTFDRSEVLVTVTTIWALPYESSDGFDALDDFERSETFPHRVKEIQVLSSDG